MERRNLLSRMSKLDTLTKIPLVELAGQNRVLIENHLGVLAYSLEEIRIKVVYGSLTVAGDGLKLMELCKEQLVITGHIDTIRLFRG